MCENYTREETIRGNTVFSISYSGNEHWIGLEKIYQLTNRPDIPMKLHIRMEDVSGNVKDAYYDTFRIEDEVCSTNISTLSSCEVN